MARKLLLNEHGQAPNVVPKFSKPTVACVKKHDERGDRVRVTRRQIAVKLGLDLPAHRLGGSAGYPWPWWRSGGRW